MAPRAKRAEPDEGEKLKVPPHLKQFARELRRTQTDAETLLWFLLRGRRLKGAKFRRQHVYGSFILDFYCLEQRLAVELDGGQHLDCAGDAVRDAALAAQGIKVLRYWNHQVLQETEAVLEAIWSALKP